MWASDVEIGVAGLKSVVIFSFMWIGVIAWSLSASGQSLVVMLHSFLSLASLPICLRPTLDIGGLSCVICVVSCLGVCFGQMCVAMSWNS